MASAVYSEPPASRLSLSLESSAASASPFPSPSSSFLPPPTPGAHEFAVRPVSSSSARGGKKPSAAETHLYPSNSGIQGPLKGSSGSLETPSAGTSTASKSASALATEHTPQILAPSAFPPLSPTLISPSTPTPSSIQRLPQPQMMKDYLEPPRSPALYQSNSSTTTPTKPTVPLPPEEEEDKPSKGDSVTLSKIIIPDLPPDTTTATSSYSSNVPSSPAFSTNSRPRSGVFMNADPSLYSNRPAPPSPAASKRISEAPSLGSTRSRSSRPPSTSVSRANSLRKTSKAGDNATSVRNSPVVNPHRTSIGSQLSQSFGPLPSPQGVSLFQVNVPPQQQQPVAILSPPPVTPVTAKRASAVVYIKVRDYGYPPTDERHLGLGEDVPKPNRVARMNRKLAGRSLSTSSIDSSDGDGEEELADDDGWGNGGGAGGWFRMGWGRISSWNTVSGPTAADIMENEKTNYPSRADLDDNFMGDGSEVDDDDGYFDDEGPIEGANYVDEEDALYPGLYRAMYAFEPEGTAEMKLVEDQIVRVIGRGGGVGWAVVLDESKPADDESTPNGAPAVRHALVPESYLEPVKLDWEDEGTTPMSAVNLISGSDPSDLLSPPAQMDIDVVPSSSA